MLSLIMLSTLLVLRNHVYGSLLEIMLSMSALLSDRTILDEPAVKHILMMYRASVLRCSGYFDVDPFLT